jgi:hypothetical protein
MNFESDINPRDMTRHPGGVSSAPPAPGCMCPICIRSRMVVPDVSERRHNPPVLDVLPGSRRYD